MPLCVPCLEYLDIGCLLFNQIGCKENLVLVPRGDSICFTGMVHRTKILKYGKLSNILSPKIPFLELILLTFICW